MLPSVIVAVVAGALVFVGVVVGVVYHRKLASDQSLWMISSLTSVMGMVFGAAIVGFVYAPAASVDGAQSQDAQSVQVALNDMAQSNVLDGLTRDAMVPMNASTMSGRVVPCLVQMDPLTGLVKDGGKLECSWHHAIQLGQSVSAPTMVSLMLQNSGLTYFPVNVSKTERAEVLDCLSTHKDAISKIKVGGEKVFDMIKDGTSCYGGESIYRLAEPENVTEKDIDSLPQVINLYKSAADQVQSDQAQSEQSENRTPGADGAQSKE